MTIWQKTKDFFAPDEGGLELDICPMPEDEIKSKKTEIKCSRCGLIIFYSKTNENKVFCPGCFIKEIEEIKR